MKTPRLKLVVLLVAVVLAAVVAVSIYTLFLFSQSGGGDRAGDVDHFQVRNRKYHLDPERIGQGPGALITTIVDLDGNETPISLVIWHSGDPPSTGVKRLNDRNYRVSVKSQSYSVLYPEHIVFVNERGRPKIVRFAWSLDKSNELTEEIKKRLLELIASQ